MGDLDRNMREVNDLCSTFQMPVKGKMCIKTGDFGDNSNACTEGECYLFLSQINNQPQAWI